MTIREEFQVVYQAPEASRRATARTLIASKGGPMSAIRAGVPDDILRIGGYTEEDIAKAKAALAQQKKPALPLHNFQSLYPLASGPTTEVLTDDSYERKHYTGYNPTHTMLLQLSCHQRARLPDSIWEAGQGEGAARDSRWSLATSKQRTWQEEFKYISENGMPYATDGQRRLVFHGLYVIRKKNAQVALYSGCSFYLMAMQVAALAKLFDQLEIPFTINKDGKEFCCGWRMIEKTKDPEERKQVLAGSKELMEKNLQSARELGAKKIAYLCDQCAHLGKMYFPNSDIQQTYLIDVLLERLEKATMHIRPRRRVAWYEGCHGRNHLLTPGISLNWEAYRSILNKVHGLDIFEIQPQGSCIEYSHQVVDMAIAGGAREIITPSGACQPWLDTAANNRIPVRQIQETLLEALQTKALEPAGKGTDSLDYDEEGGVD